MEARRAKDLMETIFGSANSSTSKASVSKQARNKITTTMACRYLLDMKRRSKERKSEE
jgi:hypothetical protein